MTYTLQQFAADIRTTLKADSSAAGRRKLCEHVVRALNDPVFLATYLKARAPKANPREILYEDSELGFCICGHVYDGPASSAPHDHGASWAIYGQAAGETEMTDWRIVERGEGGKPSLVEPVRSYVMKTGDAHFYDVGDVHSPRRDAAVKLIRIEGANLDHIKRSNVKAAQPAAAS